jgi:bile acid:Na+ symporter, BASS family
MRSFLTRLAPRGPTLLALGVLLGLAFPALAEWARPLMPVTIFLIALGTLLRIDVEAVFAALKRPSLSIFLPTMVMVASPALAGAAIYGDRLVRSAKSPQGRRMREAAVRKGRR